MTETLKTVKTRKVLKKSIRLALEKIIVWIVFWATLIIFVTMFLWYFRFIEL